MLYVGFSLSVDGKDYQVHTLVLKSTLYDRLYINKARYMAAPVACRWAVTIVEVTRAYGQEQYGQRIKDVPINRRTKRGVVA